MTQYLQIVDRSEGTSSILVRKIDRKHLKATATESTSSFPVTCNIVQDQKTPAQSVMPLKYTFESLESFETAGLIFTLLKTRNRGKVIKFSSVYTNDQTIGEKRLN